MTWWPCFMCGSASECAHREADLITWVRLLDARAARAERRRYLRELERKGEPMLPLAPLPRPKPPAREMTAAQGSAQGELFDITRRATGC
jgi:hypothetical protein